MANITRIFLEIY